MQPNLSSPLYPIANNEGTAPRGARNPRFRGGLFALEKEGEGSGGIWGDAVSSPRPGLPKQPALGGRHFSVLSANKALQCDLSRGNPRDSSRVLLGLDEPLTDLGRRDSCFLAHPKSGDLLSFVCPTCFTITWTLAFFRLFI